MFERSLSVNKKTLAVYIYDNDAVNLKKIYITKIILRLVYFTEINFILGKEQKS